uniref:Cytochrome c oxidase subunit 8 n=1 Tax=Vombatus ursinus TaxID=29139 RepID=A0A4X2K239_VOMUR
MLSLTRTSRLLQAFLKKQLIPRAHVSGRPARDPTSTGEQVAALVVVFLTFLTPSAWILGNLHNYKKSSE